MASPTLIPGGGGELVSTGTETQPNAKGRYRSSTFPFEVPIYVDKNTGDCSFESASLFSSIYTWAQHSAYLLLPLAFSIFHVLTVNRYSAISLFVYVCV